MKRLSLLALTLLLLLPGIGCDALLLGPDPASTPTALFDELWGSFDRLYTLFDVRGADWDSLRAVYRPRVNDGISEDSLFVVLSDMLAELDDSHVSLDRGGRAEESRSHTIDTVYPFSNNLPSRYLPNPGNAGDYRLTYGRIGDTVGYLRIATFYSSGSDEWAEDIDAVLRHIGDVRGLLVDLRENGGGDVAPMLAIAGRLIDRRRLFATVQSKSGPARDAFTAPLEYYVEPLGSRYTGRIAVLTNRNTVSAAEWFTMAMRTAPNVVVVGDTTRGSFSGRLDRELQNGWHYSLSGQKMLDAAGRSHEGIGMVPDVQARLTAAERELGRDPVIERAIEEVSR